MSQMENDVEDVVVGSRPARSTKGLLHKKEPVLRRSFRIVGLKPEILLPASLLFAIALGFNLYRLGTPSIWFDEAFSVELARQPLPVLWHLIFGSEPNMELYYLFLHFWLKLTGSLGLHPIEVVVRLPSAVFAALSTVVVFALGRRFLGIFVGVVAASLYLLNNAQLVAAQQTRSYSLQLLLVCLAWYALLVALSDETHPARWWICYVVTTTLAIYAHLFSGLVVVAQLVAVGGILLLPSQWRTQARKQITAFGISLLATGILIIPMLLVSLHGAETGWLPVPHFSDITTLFYSISGYNKPYVLAIAVCCMLGVLLVALGYAIHNLPVARRYIPEQSVLGAKLSSFRTFMPVAWVLFCWFLLPLVVSYVVSQGATRLFSARYLVVIVPPLFLLIGLTLALLPWRVVRAVLALGLILLALVAVPYYYRSAQVEDWNSTVPWLQQKYQPGDGMVCYDNTVDGAVKQGCQIAVEYYLHAYPSQAHFTADSPGAFSWQTYSAPDAQAALDTPTLTAYAAKHPRIFFIVGRVHDDAAAQRVQETQQWLDSHYHFVSQVVTRTVTIRLYDTTSASG